MTWNDILTSPEVASHLLAVLEAVAQERQTHTVYPASGNVLRALELTPFEDVRCVILGQDPYHGPGQAHGLAFSVPAGVELPPSLRNVLSELQSDLGHGPVMARVRASGDLTCWAKNGVLLLNTVLTVRAGEARSHKDLGWQKVTRALVKVLLERKQSCGFLLWGADARATMMAASGMLLPKEGRAHVQYAGASGASRWWHPVILSAHPSPLSAHRGFLGSKPFSTINEMLDQFDSPQVDWRLS